MLVSSQFIYFIFEVYGDAESDDDLNEQNHGRYFGDILNSEEDSLIREVPIETV